MKSVLRRAVIAVLVTLVIAGVAYVLEPDLTTELLIETITGEGV